MKKSKKATQGKASPSTNKVMTISTDKRVRTAVIPVAGLGTRFLPATKSIPKEMLPLLDRPCIDYIVAEAAEAGIERIVFVTARGKDAMVDYFDRTPALETHLKKHKKYDLLDKVLEAGERVDVISIRQRQALGLGHAVLTAKPIVGDEPFAVLLGDDIIDSDTPVVGDMIDIFHRHKKAVVSLLNIPNKDTRRYGVCSGEWLGKSSQTHEDSLHQESSVQNSPSNIMRVQNMVEKPHPRLAPVHDGGYYGIVGRYVLPPEIFDLIEDTPPGEGGEIQLTDALHMLAKNDLVLGHCFTGERFDTGNALGLLRASLYQATKRPELHMGLEDILNEMQERLTQQKSKKR